MEIADATRCSNCRTPLTGRYCAECGQKRDSGPPTFGHFVGEGIESLTHADSRLWRTLWLLLSKPGFLTKQFFDGKRAYYLPPIRLYIVFSVAFFLLLALSPDSKIETGGGDTINVQLDCKTLQYNGPFPDYIKGQLQHACERLNSAGGGEALGQAFLQNVPKAMWVLLPLFAMIMLVFWWKPKRLYAEHVLFLIHNHSAVFAVLSINMLVDLALPDVLKGGLAMLIPFYLIWYTWRGMRVFYGDSAGLTTLKFFILGFLYSACAALVLALTGIAAALTF